MAEKVSPDGTDRRSQIIGSAVSLLSEHGVSKTTTARIAADVGITEPALYRHFRNKQEILLAAFDEIGARLVLGTIASAPEQGEVVERLRLVSGAFYDFVMNNPDETRVLFEAAGATRDETTRLALADRFSELLGAVEKILEEGVYSGELNSDLDVTLAAWEIVSLGVTLHFASMLGLKDVLTRDRALAAVDRLLDSIASQERH